MRNQVHVGTLRRGRVCWVVLSHGLGPKMKVVDRSPGGTTVDRKGASRSFTTKEGKRVTIKSSRDRLQISNETLVEVNA